MLHTHLDGIVCLILFEIEKALAQSAVSYSVLLEVFFSEIYIIILTTYIESFKIGMLTFFVVIENKIL